MERKSGKNEMRRSIRIRSLLIAGLVVPVYLAGSTARAETPEKAAYMQYCSACHGSGGKGDGVVSGLMRPGPTDLTQIAKKAGGEFPFVKTMQAMDGTATIRAHGESEMPVWGEIFRDESTAPLTRRAEVRGKLILITEYLRSIQAK
jgi:mono/diheme cytochrome c family protein